MIYSGNCHCGCVHAKYETNMPVTLRHDGCSFCSSRGVKAASDPNGSIKLSTAALLTTYRFGHETADFLICAVCGTYVASSMERPNGRVGVVNVVGLNIEELRGLPAELSILEGEDIEERIVRRISRWTPIQITNV